ncbi:MAG: Holliday junction branch migration protein RuvA [Oscillospiraceae bacterium]|nr:Holliday junction branch migration protein RuvA [Oscillospiraceae bacterium]
MFYYLSGTVAHIGPNLAVIDCGGVGYACSTTTTTLSTLKKGEKGMLFTHLNVREDGVELFGFAGQDELNLFRLLLGVSGVGPKAALSILSASTPANLALSIITGDEKALTVAPGIGKKIAQRVILELKDKLAKDQSFATGGGESYAGTGVTVIPENKLSEATAALAVLGYSTAESAAALRGIDMENLTLEQIIKQALKAMMKA